MKVLQISPWSNCKNHCAFCSQRGDKPFTTEERKQHLEDIYNEFVDGSIYKKYDFEGFGIIGGEFFTGQLDEIEDTWYKLVEHLSGLLKTKKLKQVWINSNLIGVNIKQIEKTFDLFDWDVLGEDQKVLLPTSYDSKGRFHTEEDKTQWYKNVEYISKKYPKLEVYGTAITTQAFVEELLSDTFVYPTGMRALNLLVPRLTDADYFSNPLTHTKQYNEILHSKLNEYPEWFFPKSREQFIQFLYKVREVLGEGVLENFFEVERHSSDVFTYFPYKNTFFVNRHTKDNGKENMSCGHPYTSCCYLDSNHCSHCDAQKVFKYGKNY